MRIGIKIILTAAICLGLVCNSLSADASSTQLMLQDVVRTPVNLSFGGIYYSSPARKFSIDIAGDRFIKAYSDGLIIIGVKESGDSIYYLINKNKKAVLKVSQTNVYKTGQFFNWHNMTSLVNLPENTEVITENRSKEGCTLYGVAKSDARLCIDDNYHMPRFLEEKGTTIARVSYVKPLRSDLEAEVDSILRDCKLQNYNFIDVDEDMSPDAD